MRAWLELARDGVRGRGTEQCRPPLRAGLWRVAELHGGNELGIRKAADQGLAEAQHNVGMLYYHGYGVAENQRDCRELGSSARRCRNWLDAEYMLGLAYHEGKGVELNYQLAKHWFKKGALKAYGNAQFMYAFMLQAGEDGGESKPFEALVWSEVARLNGQPATSDIADIAKLKLDDEQVAEAEQLAAQCISSSYSDCPE